MADKSTKYNHRFGVSLGIEEYEALVGYAEFMGKPPATVAADLLREMYPTMNAVTKALNTAKKKHTKGITELKQLVLEEITKVSQMAADLKEEQTDLFTQTEDNHK